MIWPERSSWVVRVADARPDVAVCVVDRLSAVLNTGAAGGKVRERDIIVTVGFPA